MPTQTVVNMIYLGTFADVDPIETDTDSEDAVDLVGLYTELEILAVTENDQDDSGSIDDNDDIGTVDSLSYDVGAGTVTHELDSTIAFNADVLLGNGSTISMVIGVLQTTSGDVFIRDAGNALDNLNIQSIELVSVANNDYGGSTTGNSVENSQLVCLLEGTIVATPDGDRRVETLKAGDRVTTLDGGPKRIVYACQQVRTPGPASYPVRFSPGSLGNKLPRRTLRVSQCHRILIRSPVVQRMFGVDDVFLPAKRMLDVPGVALEQGRGDRRYFNFLLEDHDVLFAEGVPVESLFPGPQVMEFSERQLRKSLQAALIAIGKPGALGYSLARAQPTARAQKQLVQRHIKNSKPFFPSTCEAQPLDPINP